MVNQKLRRFLPWCKPAGEPKLAAQNNQDAPTQEQACNPFPVFPPPPPREILQNRDYYANSVRFRKFAAPERETEDKPLFALYRLYEHIVLDNNIGMRNELELFWWKPWPVADIPDPQDQDQDQREPERYAVLSCIPALLVESFNQRIDMGLRREEPHSILSPEEQQRWAATPRIYETLPTWTRHVAPLPRTLCIPHSISDEPQLDGLDDPRASVPFREKNILLWKPHIHFL